MGSDKVFVIAEVGSSHDGDLDNALILIKYAAECGADAVKLQWVSNVARLVERRRAYGYEDAYKLINFPPGWHARLRQECRRYDVEYVCTVYTPEDISVVAPYVERFKIASFEAGDEAFLNAHLPYDKPMIISTGMMEGAAYEALEAWRRREYIDRDIVLLQCTSSYPAGLDAINLNTIKRGLAYGLSDHSRHPLTGAVAVGAGARIVEAHIRGPFTSPANADYAHSMSIGEFRTYVANIRAAEQMMGDGIKRCHESEEVMAQYRSRGDT